VKERDLPRWTHILEKASVSIEELDQGIDQFASLEKLCQNRQQKADKLETSIKSLTAQVNSLTDERDKISAAIIAIRDSALTEVELTGRKIREDMDALMQEAENYKKLQEQAAVLGNVVTLAMAIKSPDPNVWSQIGAEEIRILLLDILLWCKADPSHNPDLEAPTGSLTHKAVFYSYYRITLLEVLNWIRKSL